MIILGIETSCDETAASLVQDGVKILSDIVSSSQELHIKTGGIIPEVAAREQIRCVIPVIEAAIENCKLKIENLDAIAVTIGPGLIGSLLVGVETAKTLAYVWRKPIIPVNHLLAHIYANWLNFQKTEDRIQKTVTSKTENSIRATVLPPYRPPKFPLVGLIASGGHTELILMKGHGKYTWLGGTRDDAAGEAFDKIARILGLGYPGGPAIAAAAKKFRIQSASRRTKFQIKLPRPMINSDDFDFSFSGLKTAVIRELTNLMVPRSNDTYHHSETVKNQFAYEVQEAITDVLVEKVIKAAQEYDVKSILLAGGVAANQRLREKLSNHPIIQSSNYQVFIPPPSLCTDNAACVASCAFFNYSPISWRKIQAEPSLIIS